MNENGLSKPVSRRECDLVKESIFHRLDRIDKRMWNLLAGVMILLVGSLLNIIITVILKVVAQ